VKRSNTSVPGERDGPAGEHRPEGRLRRVIHHTARRRSRRACPSKAYGPAEHSLRPGRPRRRFGGEFAEAARRLAPRQRRRRRRRSGQHRDDLFAHRIGTHLEIEQDAGGNAFSFAHEAEQEVLGPDVVVTKRQRLAGRELNDPFRSMGQRDLARRDFVTLADDERHLGAYLFDGDVE
jgi:hypothetical protein